MRLAACLGILIALFGFVGCSPDVPTGIPVSGTVSYQGSPLDQGQIEFSPTGKEGILSGAPIVNGEYSIPDENGLAPGEYAVRIFSSTGGTEAVEELPGESKVTAKQRIPAEFNTATKLKAAVTESGENKFDFQIP